MVAVDASSPAVITKNTATGTTMVTASFTAPTNALLVAYIGVNTPGVAQPNNCTVADTGGLTWTLWGRKSPNATSTNGTGTDGAVEIWTAPTVSAAARTVTVTMASADFGAFMLKAFTDAAGVPRTGAITGTFSTSGLPTGALTTTAANSWAWAVATDYNVTGSGTVGASQTLQSSIFTSGIQIHFWSRTAVTAGSGTAVTQNLTAPAAQYYDMLTNEIMVGQAAAAFSPPVGVKTGPNAALYRANYF